MNSGRKVLGLDLQSPLPRACGLCGGVRELSKAHVPPRAAGNGSTVRRARQQISNGVFGPTRLSWASGVQPTYDSTSDDWSGPPRPPIARRFNAADRGSYAAAALRPLGSSATRGAGDDAVICRKEAKRTLLHRPAPNQASRPPNRSRRVRATARRLYRTIPRAVPAFPHPEIRRGRDLLDYGQLCRTWDGPSPGSPRISGVAS